MLLWYIVGEVNKMPRKERTPFQRNLETLFDEYKRALFEKGLTCTREMFAQHIGATLGKFKGWMSASTSPAVTTTTGINISATSRSSLSDDKKEKPCEESTSRGFLVL